MMTSSEIKSLVEKITDELIKPSKDVKLDKQVKTLFSSILYNRLHWKRNLSVKELELPSEIQFVYDWIQNPRFVRSISRLLDLSAHQNQLRDSIILELIQHLKPFCKEPGVFFNCQCGCDFSKVISYYPCHYDKITSYQVKCYQCEGINELYDYQIEETYLDSEWEGMGRANADYQLSQLKNQINILIGDPKDVLLKK